MKNQFLNHSFQLRLVVQSQSPPRRTPCLSPMWDQWQRLVQSLKFNHASCRHQPVSKAFGSRAHICGANQGRRSRSTSVVENGESMPGKAMQLLNLCQSMFTTNGTNECLGRPCNRRTYGNVRPDVLSDHRTRDMVLTNGKLIYGHSNFCYNIQSQLGSTGHVNYDS